MQDQSIHPSDNRREDLRMLNDARANRDMARVIDRTQRVEDRLTRAVSAAEDAFASYVNFRKTRGRGGKDLPVDRQIVRTASYPSSHVMTFSVLAGLVLIEGLINAQFFAKGSDLGLLGGWIQAITVAFTNVIAAFFLVGFLAIRALSNPDRPFAFGAAVVGLPLAIIGIIFLNFTAAHYRDLLEINAAVLAQGDFTETGEYLAPVSRALSFGQFETLEALILFLLGMTFAAIAAFKGATFDDRIIGYGTVQRHLERAEAHLAGVLKQTPRESRMMGSDGSFDTVREAQQVLADIRSYRRSIRERVVGDSYASDRGGEAGSPPPPPPAR